MVPVGWSTWITRSLADQAEKAGSIQVAVIQLANTCGAAIGGYALDNIGLDVYKRQDLHRAIRLRGHRRSNRCAVACQHADRLDVYKRQVVSRIART